MNISEAIDILTKERFSKKAPKWKNLERDLNQFAVECIDAALQDAHAGQTDVSVVQCKGCGFIISSLLTNQGCPNCGIDDLTEDIRVEK